MNSLSDIIREHASRYPLMQPCDAVKLVYQSEFGGGHLVSSSAASMERLEEECRLLPVPPRESASSLSGQIPYSSLAESIGGGISRVSLSHWKALGLPLALLNQLFVCSAVQKMGRMDSFAQKLEMLSSLAEERIFSFSPSALRAYLDEYRALGCPAVSHSQIYKNTYCPAYRLVWDHYLPLLPALCSIDQLIAQKSCINLAIDGCAAAGKSTVAQLISSLFPSRIVHMDDFFLPPALRTPQRFHQPGGNIHYERFEAQVVPGLKAHRAFYYAPYACSTGQYLPMQEFPAAALTIVEGCYSLHPHWANVFDYKLFLDISPKLQKERILQRNGKDMLQRFTQLWIPLEHQYFDAFHIPESCDLILTLP